MENGRIRLTIEELAAIRVLTGAQPLTDAPELDGMLAEAGERSLFARDLLRPDELGRPALREPLKRLVDMAAGTATSIVIIENDGRTARASRMIIEGADLLLEQSVFQGVNEYTWMGVQHVSELLVMNLGIEGREWATPDPQRRETGQIAVHREGDRIAPVFPADWDDVRFVTAVAVGDGEGAGIAWIRERDHLWLGDFPTSSEESIVVARVSPSELVDAVRGFVSSAVEGITPAPA